jgi:para-aminobenzoate synthetase/4-amino-4-deoxychorismate lyase
MVSTVNARLEDGRSLVDVIRALFPCGSVTGAPKIRAMELIHAHERDPRGIYCGSLGHIDPANATNSAGSASFNVAIRSLRLAPDGKAVLGVGSAVVADSVAIDEWRECLVKGGFVHQPAPDKMIAGFDLIETMAFDPELGVPMLEAHLERMKESAGLLGFSFDRRAQCDPCPVFRGGKAFTPAPCSGAQRGDQPEVGPLPAPMDGDAPVPVIALPIPLDTGDWRLRHKTTDRWFYDAGLKAARAEGAREAIFVRDDGLLTEGCFTSIFVERDGILLTPPLALGLLPGCCAGP